MQVESEIRKEERGKAKLRLYGSEIGLSAGSKTRKAAERARRETATLVQRALLRDLGNASLLRAASTSDRLSTVEGGKHSLAFMLRTRARFRIGHLPISLFSARQERALQRWDRRGRCQHNEHNQKKPVPVSRAYADARATC